ncbi:hypothetical protein G7062_04250 [Erysipelothrix sp. HDW6C]|uniref:hypothetical protein n=1 Tax=Erysipelothrix sp. HDW6C TaxID=2714930 RepID=UPI0014094FB7|nr:hypothetical protein [Erysipelothrix sp. HDW6C]QIK69554.1 hypothetical protein G7062_04250 [Erysipelothrix sp. HDW6C]
MKGFYIPIGNQTKLDDATVMASYTVAWAGGVFIIIDKITATDAVLESKPMLSFA